MLKNKYFVIIILIVLFMPTIAHAETLIDISAVMMKLVNFGREMVISMGASYKTGTGFLIFTVVLALSFIDFIMTAASEGDSQAWTKGLDIIFWFIVMLLLYGDISYDFYSTASIKKESNTPYKTQTVPMSAPSSNVPAVLTTNLSAPIIPQENLADRKAMQDAVKGPDSKGLIKSMPSRSGNTKLTLLDQLFNFIKDLMDDLSGAGVSMNVDAFSKTMTVGSLAKDYCRSNASTTDTETCGFNLSTKISYGLNGRMNNDLYRATEMVVDARHGCYGSGTAVTKLGESDLLSGTGIVGSAADWQKQIKDTKVSTLTGGSELLDSVSCGLYNTGFVFRNLDSFGMRAIMWTMNIIAEVVMAVLLVLVALEMVVLGMIGSYIWPFIIYHKTRPQVIEFIKMYLSFAMIPGVMSLLQNIFDAMIMYMFQSIMPWLAGKLLVLAPVVGPVVFFFPGLIVQIVVTVAIAIMAVKLMFVKESQEIAGKLFKGQFGSLGGLAGKAMAAIGQVGAMAMGAGALAGAGAGGMKGGMSNILSKGADKLSGTTMGGPLGSMARLAGGAGKATMSGIKAVDNKAQSAGNFVAGKAMDANKLYNNFSNGGKGSSGESDKSQEKGSQTNQNSQNNRGDNALNQPSTNMEAILQKKNLDQQKDVQIPADASPQALAQAAIKSGILGDNIPAAAPKKGIITAVASKLAAKKEAAEAVVKQKQNIQQQEAKAQNMKVQKASIPQRLLDVKSQKNARLTTEKTDQLEQDRAQLTDAYGIHGAERKEMLNQGYTESQVDDALDEQLKEIQATHAAEMSQLAAEAANLKKEKKQLPYRQMEDKITSTASSVANGVGNISKGVGESIKKTFEKISNNKIANTLKEIKGVYSEGVNNANLEQQARTKELLTGRELSDAHHLHAKQISAVKNHTDNSIKKYETTLQDKVSKKDQTDWD